MLLDKITINENNINGILNFLSLDQSKYSKQFRNQTGGFLNFIKDKFNSYMSVGIDKILNISQDVFSKYLADSPLFDIIQRFNTIAVELQNKGQNFIQLVNIDSDQQTNQLLFNIDTNNPLILLIIDLFNFFLLDIYLNHLTIKMKKEKDSVIVDSLKNKINSINDKGITMDDIIDLLSASNLNHTLIMFVTALLPYICDFESQINKFPLLNKLGLFSPKTQSGGVICGGLCIGSALIIFIMVLFAIATIGNLVMAVSFMITSSVTIAIVFPLITQIIMNVIYQLPTLIILLKTSDPDVMTNISMQYFQSGIAQSSNKTLTHQQSQIPAYLSTFKYAAEISTSAFNVIGDTVNSTVSKSDVLVGGKSDPIPTIETHIRKCLNIQNVDDINVDSLCQIFKFISDFDLDFCDLNKLIDTLFNLEPNNLHFLEKIFMIKAEQFPSFLSGFKYIISIIYVIVFNIDKFVETSKHGDFKFFSQQEFKLMFNDAFKNKNNKLIDIFNAYKFDDFITSRFPSSHGGYIKTNYKHKYRKYKNKYLNLTK